MYIAGDKIKFKKEKQRYIVRACNNRFIIATKPFNAKKTFLYVIVDLVNKIRGPDNFYCRFNYEDPIEAQEALELLIESTEGKEEYDYNFYISTRNRIELDIENKDR
jgi:hypothetical protein